LFIKLLFILEASKIEFTQSVDFSTRFLHHPKKSWRASISMMLMPLIMSLQATELADDSEGAMFGANEARMGLANGESPTGIASLAQQDKAIELQGVQAKTNYQVAQVMFGNANRLRKKDQELTERMRRNGALFV
jgi:hypothetical protein